MSTLLTLQVYTRAKIILKISGRGIGVLRGGMTSAQQQGEAMMPQFNPELIQLMRSVLEDVMTRVPPEKPQRSALLQSL
jgi:hypothetical protein